MNEKLYTRTKTVTAILAAAANGHVRCVKLLIEAGADPNIGGVYQDTAIMSAVSNGHLECLKVLIEAGVDVNAKETSSG